MTLTDLLFPVLVAAVAVFLVSSVVHMLLPLHKGDYRQLPDEADKLAALRRGELPPGDYMFPYCRSMQELGTPEFRSKLDAGPVGSMTIRPNGPMAMGRSLGQWFAYSVVISVLVAYLARQALPAGAPAGDVLQFTSAAAFLGYALWSVNDSIWKGVAWSTTLKFAFDGLLYALATGAVFAWLWPTAA